MKFAVTIVSPPNYVHSACFEEIAETIDGGLRALGHDSARLPVDELGGRRPIVLGSNLLPWANIPLPTDAILYNLEQIDDQSMWMRPDTIERFRRSIVWDYSAINVERLAALGIAARLVPLGYVPSLTRIPDVAERDIDVLFYGSMSPRRKAVLDQLRAEGAAVTELFGVYGAERDAVIARAKLVLNMHYYEAKVFEVVRVSYLLANRRTVVSERGADLAEEMIYEDAVAFADYDQLAGACLRLLRDEPGRAELADRGLTLMRSRPEERFLAPALAALG